MLKTLAFYLIFHRRRTPDPSKSPLLPFQPASKFRLYWLEGRFSFSRNMRPSSRNTYRLAYLPLDLASNEEVCKRSSWTVFWTGAFHINGTWRVTRSPRENRCRKTAEATSPISEILDKILKTENDLARIRTKVIDFMAFGVLKIGWIVLLESLREFWEFKFLKIFESLWKPLKILESLWRFWGGGSQKSSKISEGFRSKLFKTPQNPSKSLFETFQIKSTK